ncbi:ArsR/SmtB family transcription factor [Pseudonocardia lutea]|jgi:DNA-binding transcriptional ArsR family regulator|uniref:ArsR/SmtB family transcription factor n=1 Tax=Pseudonocardia lutea TaxID=2172015 RepID=A0ABW1I3I4_9PSEU
MSAGDDTSGRAARRDLAFDALADPVRREILAVLAEEDECSAGALAGRITSVGRTAVSTHLRVLRVAGLVTERRAGRYRYYSVDPSGSAAEVLTLLQGLFQQSLHGVRAAVENRPPETGPVDTGRTGGPDGTGPDTAAEAG